MNIIYIFLLFVTLSATTAFGDKREKRSSSIENIINNLKNKLFSISCEGGYEHLYSNWTTCGWPHGDLRVVIADFLSDARDKGCKIPFRALVKLGFQHLKEGDYKNHPFYRRIPDKECGFCGRKAKCCRKARSFLTQTFTSDTCGDTSPPCTTKPLDEAFIESLRPFYPEVIPPEDCCNLKPYVDAELDKLHSGEAFQYVKPLMCQILGTTRPKVNCKRDGSLCKCCCTGYKYENESCVRDLEEQIDPLC